MDSGTLNFGAGAISGAKVLRVTPLNDGKMFMKKGRAPWSVTDLQRAVYPGRTKADFKLAQPKAAPDGSPSAVPPPTYRRDCPKTDVRAENACALAVAVDKGQGVAVKGAKVRTGFNSELEIREKPAARLFARRIVRRPSGQARTVDLYRCVNTARPDRLPPRLT
eukprot:9499634-Pyramimonas_sp.AAC.2